MPGSVKGEEESRNVEEQKDRKRDKKKGEGNEGKSDKASKYSGLESFYSSISL